MVSQSKNSLWSKGLKHLQNLSENAVHQSCLLHIFANIICIGSNSVDIGKTAPVDLGQHCLPKTF